MQLSTCRSSVRVFDTMLKHASSGSRPAPRLRSKTAVRRPGTTATHIDKGRDEPSTPPRAIVASTGMIIEAAAAAAAVLLIADTGALCSMLLQLTWTPPLLLSLLEIHTKRAWGAPRLPCFKKTAPSFSIDISEMPGADGIA